MTDYTSNLVQEQLVGYWAKTKGITRLDLLKHPCINDVILILNIRQEFQYDLLPQCRVELDKIWKSVYQGKIPLKKKQLKALENITNGMLNWRKVKAEKQQQTRQLIKTLNKKSADDIVAKAADTTQTPPWE